MARKKSPRKDVKTTRSPASDKPFNDAPVVSAPIEKTKGLSSITTAPAKLSDKKLNRFGARANKTGRGWLQQEKEKAKRIKALLEGLHPGCIVPEKAVFNGLVLSRKALERCQFIDNLFINTKFRYCQLRSAIFRNCDLSGADFRYADMPNCIFDHCNLQGTDLRHCNLSNARIVDCNLYAANLDNSRLDNAMIDHCDMGAQSFYSAECKGLQLFNSPVYQGFLESADFSQAQFLNVQFRDCTLSNTCFDRALLDECRFRACESSQQGPVFSGCKMTNSIMEDCELDDLQLIGSQIMNSRIDRVQMVSALLENTLFSQVVFTDDILKDCYSLEGGVAFHGCQLDHLVLDHTELCQARFDHSKFISTAIRGCDFNSWELTDTEVDSKTTVDSCFLHES